MKDGPESASAKARMSRAIVTWTAKLDDYPGWQEWQRAKINYMFDEEFTPPAGMAAEFKFSADLDIEHAVIIQYMALLDTVNSLRDVEWYFRRYPFKGTPVTRHSHLTHCCEMFFSRFYQFRERLKNLLNALKRAAPDREKYLTHFLKIFDKTFDSEIRARHGVHHRERFDERAISRVLLLEILVTSPTDQGLERERLTKYRRQVSVWEYRRQANLWAVRTRRQADTMEQFVEAIAAALLEICPFLDVTGRRSGPLPSKP